MGKNILLNAPSFSKEAHLHFISDSLRVGKYKEAINRLAPGKVVLDLGTGTGIMAAFAADAGANRVMAIEKDPAIAEDALKNFRHNGGPIELVLADILRLEKKDLPEDIGLIIGEMLSTWCVAEKQVPAHNHLFRTLGYSPLTTPSRVMLMAEGAYAELLDELGLVQVDIAHYTDDRDLPPVVPLTERKLVHGIDLGIINPLVQRLEFTLRTILSGTINALRLFSPIELAEGINLYSSHTVMEPEVVRLPAPVQVAAGSALRVQLEFEFGAGWENFHIRLPA